MEILIDKRIELITIVQNLCNYWEDFQIKHLTGPLCRSKYRENVHNYFGKFKDHKIIELYNSVIHDIWDISAFINMALCFSNPPEMDIIADYENNFGKINTTTFPYEEFINELRQFYIDSDFNQFYENNQTEYQKMLNNYGSKTELSANTVFDYLDIKNNNYKIIISSLTLDGCGFGIRVKTNNNVINEYSVISPYSYNENNYLFGPINNRKSYVWHEICHLIINDLTKCYINQFDIDINQVPEIYLKNLINNKETIINEYIIRAITIRLFEKNGENEFAELLIQNDIKKGFKDVELLKDHIKQNFENDHVFMKDDRYKELMGYVIKLI